MTSRYDAVRARMNIGELYVDYGERLEELEAERTRGKELLYDFNHSRPSEVAERLRLLRALLGAVGEGVWIEPPFFASYTSRCFFFAGAAETISPGIAWLMTRCVRSVAAALMLAMARARTVGFGDCASLSLM